MTLDEMIRRLANGELLISSNYSIQCVDKVLFIKDKTLDTTHHLVLMGNIFELFTLVPSQNKLTMVGERGTLILKKSEKHFSIQITGSTFEYFYQFNPELFIKGITEC